MVKESLTPEEKQILIRSLCEMLPYKVKVHIEHDIFYDERDPYDSILSTRTINDFTRSVKLEVKPYLRPMSDMTEDEIREWDTIVVMMRNMPVESISMCSKFVNSHHLDHNNLISKGLALPAPTGMYN